MAVCVIQNSTLGGPGLLGAYLERRGMAIESIVSFRDIVETPFESLEADLVVILGSPRGVYETEEAWIRREHAMVEHLMKRGVPIFGICFGAQLLAKVFGGEVRPMDRPFREWLANDVAPSEDWRGPWLRWHGDRIYLPAGIEAIAARAGIVQAFRHETAVGVQFHPEVTPEILRSWITTLPEGTQEAARGGPLAYLLAQEHDIRARSFRLFDTILKELLPAGAPADMRSI